MYLSANLLQLGVVLVRGHVLVQRDMCTDIGREQLNKGDALGISLWLSTSRRLAEAEEGSTRPPPSYWNERSPPLKLPPKNDIDDFCRDN